MYSWGPRANCSNLSAASVNFDLAASTSSGAERNAFAAASLANEGCGRSLLRKKSLMVFTFSVASCAKLSRGDGRLQTTPSFSFLVG